MKIKKYLVIFSLIILIYSVFLLFSACEPGGRLTINNRLDQDLQVFIAHVRSDGSIDELTYQITVPANSTKSFGITFINDQWVNRIVLKNIDGNTIFTHDYTMPDLKKINWAMTIPP